MSNLPTTMQALQLQGLGQLAEVQLPVPRPAAGEVLISTQASTICASDFNDIDLNPFGVKFPRVLGHEGAGVVASTGSDVQSLKPGDRVAAHPVISCHRCHNCQTGLAHLCPHMGHLGLDRDGTFAEYFCIPYERVRKLPPQADFATAALLEPVAVCLEAIQRGRIQTGETVLVVGDGPFGILMTRLIRSTKFQKVILLGQHDFRLRQVPNAITINGRNVSDPVSAIQQANGGVGVDVAILAVGSQSAFDICLASLRARGRAVIFSALHSHVRLDMFRLHTHELEIVGACNDQDLIDPALASLVDQDLQLSTLVTHRIPFAEWKRAFALARDGKDSALKVALTFQESL